MGDTSISNKKTAITLEIQTKYLVSAEQICEKFDMCLNEYLNDCIVCGVNTDLEDQIVFSKSRCKAPLIDYVISNPK